jgi:predicted nucleic acid-binding protein
MSDKSFVDTNVLIYAHDVDARVKHQIAKAVVGELWSERTDVLSMQVLQEFYVTSRETFRRPCQRTWRALR